MPIVEKPQSTWKCEPAMKDGKSVALQVSVVVTLGIY